MPDAQTSVQADRRETVQPEYRSAAEPTEEEEEEMLFVKYSLAKLLRY